MELKPGLAKVHEITNHSSGIYILEIFCQKDFQIKLPKFNRIIFPSGWYYYIGSAQKNLLSRIERHRNGNKNIHWHIDHLTTVKSNTIKNIIVFENYTKDFECRLTNDIHELFETKFIAPGFGNSDCRKCISHLLFTSKSLFGELITSYSDSFHLK